MKSFYDFVYTVLVCRASVRDAVRLVPLPVFVKFIASSNKLLVCFWQLVDNRKLELVFSYFNYIAIGKYPIVSFLPDNDYDTQFKPKLTYLLVLFLVVCR